MAPEAYKAGFTSTQFIKWLLVICNTCHFILGLGLIGAGVVTQEAYKNYISFLNFGYRWTADLNILVGIVVSVVSFLGCCSVWKRHLYRVTTYNLAFSIVSGCLFALVISGVIAAYIQRNNIQTYLTACVADSMNSTDPQVANLWAHTQETLHCCGARGYRDWIYLNNEIPRSCCNLGKTVSILINGTCNLNWKSPEYVGCYPLPADKNCPIYVGGCANRIRFEAEEHMRVVAAVGLTVASIQIACMTLSYIWAKRERSEYQELDTAGKNAHIFHIVPISGHSKSFSVKINHGTDKY
ncbi:CD151 antigen-like [Paramacrobiotus metropolitanus]|uniref:CD151 antigen-like n=1 Tax=Paramacrobiotus metropolitanus TaxID=2943436 RepID=UPI002445D4C4|nr:CD151 antigen-like [Paramacrobiotus metropolitanus]